MTSPDRVALVAGATGPIGRATARQLAARGWNVALHYNSSRARAEALAEAIGARARVFGADLTAPDAAAALVSEVSRWGSLAALVNTVHPVESTPAPVADLGAGVLASQLAAVELHASLCAAVVPGMRANGGGTIVYVAGALMTRPAPGFGAFGAAKAAAATLTRYLALEEGRNGIRANIVAPGRVAPDEPEELDDEWRALELELLARTALGGFPTSDDVARSIATLVGDDGAMLTGQTIWVTGGEPIA